MKNSIAHGVTLFLLVSLLLTLFCGMTVFSASTPGETKATQAPDPASDIIIESTDEWLQNRGTRSTAGGAYAVSTLHQLPCQYSDESGEQQNMSYVIMTAKGKIIVIDGGYRISDPEYLLAYLKKITGKDRPNVDAWFLTHAHADHVGAFRAIASKYSDQITVEAVYHRLPTEAEIDKYFYNDDPAGLKTKVQQVHSACALLKTKSGATTPHAELHPCI